MVRPADSTAYVWDYQSHETDGPGYRDGAPDCQRCADEQDDTRTLHINPEGLGLVLTQRDEVELAETRADHSHAYPDDDYDGYDPYEDDRAPEDTGYVDEQNMNLIAASTESEDEEDADFDAIFREIERTLDKDGRY